MREPEQVRRAAPDKRRIIAAIAQNVMKWKAGNASQGRTTKTFATTGSIEDNPYM